MTHPDQDIIDFLTKDLDLRAAPDWMIERARAFRDGGWSSMETAPKDEKPFYIGILARWVRYKKGAPKWALKLGGRFQRWNGYGWENVDFDPDDAWRPLPNPPKDTEQ